MSRIVASRIKYKQVHGTFRLVIFSALLAVYCSDICLVSKRQEVPSISKFYICPAFLSAGEQFLMECQVTTALSDWNVQVAQQYTIDRKCHNLFDARDMDTWIIGNMQQCERHMNKDTFLDETFAFIPLMYFADTFTTLTDLQSIYVIHFNCIPLNPQSVCLYKPSSRNVYNIYDQELMISINLDT